MPSNKQLALLAAAALVMTGGAVAVHYTSLSVSRITPGDKLLPDLAGALDSVDKITVSHDGETATLIRADKGWVEAERDNYPAKTELVHQMLVGMSQLSISEARTSSPDLYGRLDVEEPAKGNEAAGVKLEAGSKVVADLIVGKERPGGLGGTGQALYVRREGEPQSWLVTGTFDMQKTTNGWLDRSVADIDRKRVKSVTLSGTDRQPLTVQKTDSGDSFVLKDMPAGRKVDQDWKIGNVAGAFEIMDFDDVHKAPADTGAKPYQQAVLTTTDGLTLTASLLKQEDKVWLAVKAVAADSADDKVKKEADAINARTAGWVYKVPGYKLERLQATVDTLTVPDKPAASGG
ncbi:DUF4340 domain-containing protein [Radicibacter daui]|uniref:DUF4340 domain-containing protein n=1 Tax=Radicibacter daui TaxID=3064829 RepID=UPI004046C50D